jgi:nucleoside-diphosphate-sugar epimerase
MKILITGSTGFLGKELVSQLATNSIFELNRGAGDYICDLSNEIPTFQNSFDLIIHNAGKAHSVPKTNEEREIFFDVNVVGTGNLLKGLEMSIPKQFIFISSVAVYGIDQGELIAENAKLLAKDPYGVSKIEAEKLVQKWCNKHNVVCTIFRLPLVVGSSPPGNLGAMLKAIKKGYYFNVAGGKAKKSMVLAEDVAKFCLIVAPIGGIYNLTDGQHPSFMELSENIAQNLGMSSPKNIPNWLAYCFSCIGDLLGDKAPLNRKKFKKITTDLTFDDTKARQALGWNPNTVLDYFKNKRII